MVSFLFSVLFAKKFVYLKINSYICQIKVEIMNVLILNEEKFKETYPILKNRKDMFFISILDPDSKKKSLFRPKESYKTWKFYDLDSDIQNYKAISYEQAREIRNFIVNNLDKTLVVHCTAGIARSGAIGEFYWELLGGSYKDLTEKYKWISPNGRVLSYLRMCDKEDKFTIKANFI